MTASRTVSNRGQSDGPPEGVVALPRPENVALALRFRARGRTSGLASRSRSALPTSHRQQLGQLGDIGGDPAGLVVREHAGLPSLVLVSPEVRVGDGLPVGILDAERLLKLADGPGRREAAGHSAFYLGDVHIDAAGLNDGLDCSHEISVFQ